jgi:hypothetical protein
MVEASIVEDEAVGLQRPEQVGVCIHTPKATAPSKDLALNRPFH